MSPTTQCLVDIMIVKAAVLISVFVGRLLASVGVMGPRVALTSQDSGYQLS